MTSDTIDVKPKGGFDMKTVVMFLVVLVLIFGLYCLYNNHNKLKTQLGVHDNVLKQIFMMQQGPPPEMPPQDEEEIPTAMEPIAEE